MSCENTLTIPVGYSYPLSIVIEDEGELQDLTGWAFQFTVKVTPSMEIVASADAVVAGTEAVVDIPDTLEVGSYTWAIRATPPVGVPFPLVDNARLIVTLTTTREP